MRANTEKSQLEFKKKTLEKNKAKYANTIKKVNTKNKYKEIETIEDINTVMNKTSLSPDKKAFKND